MGNYLGKPRTRTMTPVEVAWVAGLLEGDGSFMAIPKRGVYHGRVSIFLTDRDVLEKLAAVVGVGNVRAVDNRGSLGSRPVFCWVVSGSLDVIAICEAVLPHLGARRTQQATAALQAARSIQATYAA